MILKVNPHKIEIVKSPVNEREINISKCTFEFADEITNDYVKEAYFTFGGTTYKQIIVNDECDFPSEVLTKKGTVEIGVVAYLVENETEIKRYNPSPAYFDTWVGSLKDNAENSEPITPSEMEQFEQALNDGLNEVNDKLDEIDQAIDDVNEAIIETNNLDLDVDKQGKVATVTITKKDTSTKIVTLSDGTSLMFNWDGTKLGIKTDDEQSYTYVDLEGPQGPQGVQGEAFTIKKTYSSIAEMNADFNNMQVGDYVMIANSVETEDNAKLYTRGEEAWIFITDFSGATGIQGEQGPQGIQGPQGPQGIPGPQGEPGATGNGILSIQKTATAGLVDTYTITFTDGTTTTFDVTNGEDGEVTQAQLDETNDNVSWLQTLTEQMPHVAGQGTDLSLESVLNYRLMKFLPQGVSSQESTTGANILNNINYSLGNIDAEGNDIGSTNTYRFNEYVSINEQTTIYLLKRLVAVYYNENKEYISQTSSGALTLTTPAGTKYARFRTFAGDFDTFNNTDFMVSLSSITSYEPYTGGIAAPNPSYPFMPSRVTGENSLVLQNENLYNKNTSVSEELNGSDGSTSSSNTYSTSDYIRVEPGQDYYLTGKNDGYSNCFYDNNKNFIQTIQKTTGVITVPNNQNIAFIRFNSNKTYKNTIMFIKGSTAPTTYIANQTQTYQLSLGNIELNSSPDGTIRDQIKGSSDVSYNLFNKDDVIKGNYQINSSHSLVSSNSNRVLFIPCKPNTTYTVLKKISNYFTIGFINEEPNANISVAGYMRNPSLDYLTSTSDSDSKYLACWYYNTGETLTEQEILDSIQITEGSEVKPYFPYGQVGMWYKREYIGKVVLDGSESWTFVSNSAMKFSLNINGIAKPVNQNTLPKMLSDNFRESTWNNAINSDDDYLMVVSTSNEILRIKDNDFSTLADFKAWLSTHNTTIYYPLAEYTDIPITDTTLISQLNDIYNNAHSYNGVTNITTTYEDGNEQMYLDIEALKNVWDTSL